MSYPEFIDFNAIIIGLAISGLMAIISYRLKALSGSGTVGMIIIGTLIFGLGQIPAAVPLILFFISSSLLSKLNNSHKTAAMKFGEKGSKRDIWQVFANGGVGATCIVVLFLTRQPVWFFCYLASISEAAADTWATEIGTMSRISPVSILSLRRVEAGMSGGITLVGTSAALTGSIFITLSVFIMQVLFYPAQHLSTALLGLSAGGGFIGSIIDSILGSSIQARFQCPTCNRLTERRIHCGTQTVSAGGVWCINNDAVNFLSALSAAILVYLFWHLLSV